MAVRMAPEPGEARQLAGAHSLVLDRKTAGRRLAVFAVAFCCSKTCWTHHGVEVLSQCAAVADDELHHWSVGLVHSRLVAVHTDSGVPVRVAHAWGRSSVVRETRSAAVRLQQAEAPGAAGCYRSKSEVEIYCGHRTSKGVFVPRCFACYDLHGLPLPCLLSCYRMLGRHYLAESSLVCWQPRAIWPSPSPSTLPLRSSWGPVGVAAPGKIHPSIAVEAAVGLADLWHLFAPCERSLDPVDSFLRDVLAGPAVAEEGHFVGQGLEAGVVDLGSLDLAVAAVVAISVHLCDPDLKSVVAALAILNDSVAGVHLCLVVAGSGDHIVGHVRQHRDTVHRHSHLLHIHVRWAPVHVLLCLVAVGLVGRIVDHASCRLRDVR